jgi:hypothetical protein
MTEQEIYDALCAYVKATDVAADEESARMTFLVVVATEIEGQMTVGSAIVDPKVPNRIKGPPIGCTVGQQTMLYLKDNLEEPTIQATEAAIQMWRLAKQMGVKKLKRIADKCDNSDEFYHRIKKALEEDPEIKLDFEVNIEKHGTG